MFKKFLQNVTVDVITMALAIGILFCGIMSVEAKKAEIDEEIIYPVTIATNTEYGYIPKSEFELNRPSLEAYIKLCWWNAQWLESGDLLIGFDGGDETWFVKLRGDDPEINTIRHLVTKYELMCFIPDR